MNSQYSGVVASLKTLSKWKKNKLHSFTLNEISFINQQILFICKFSNLDHLAIFDWLTIYSNSTTTAF